MENLMGKLKGETRFTVIIRLAAKWLRILSLGGNTNFAKSSIKYLHHIMEKTVCDQAEITWEQYANLNVQRTKKCKTITGENEFLL